MQCETLTQLTDGELLGRYITDADQDAFAEMVERYQPMVLRVCRQVLGNSSEAGDASQQVFIALSLKAALLQDRHSVASWLYRVAWNISSKTRRAFNTRVTHEQSAPRNPGKSYNQPVEPDTLMVLHEALAEIPEIYRQAIVLHYFCGYTTAEAAARLRCPAGTFAARVSRGLQQLRTQLANRDLILTIVAMKLILLGIMSGSKAAAAATTTAARVKGGLPRYRPPYRLSTKRLLLRGGRALALLPAGIAFADGGAVFASGGSVSGYTWGSSLNPLLDFVSNLFGRFIFQMKTKPAIACALAAGLCAGAGAAARSIVVAHAPPAPSVVPASVFPDDPKPSKDVDPPKKDDDENARPTAYSSSGPTPVPEPASLSILGCASLALLGRRRARRS